jgi:hypothetical protein
MPAVVIIGEAPGHATPPGRVFALAGAIRKVRRVRSRANAAEYTRLFRNRRQTRGLVEIVSQPTRRRHSFMPNTNTRQWPALANNGATNTKQ